MTTYDGEGIIFDGDDTEKESIGPHTVIYTDMGTFKDRLIRLEKVLGEPPSAVLLSVMPKRHIEGKWGIEIRGYPKGYFLDGAPTLEDAKVKAREIMTRFKLI